VAGVSNTETHPDELVAGAVATAPGYELLTGREVVLGGPRGLPVSRTLPHRDRRMIGAWCFVDFYGPHDVSSGAGMRVPPHPHTGLQTVSWLVAGEVHHTDSLGSDQLVRPGQLNLMTAGRGIAHAEVSPPDRSPQLHGVQLWVALPAAARDVAPAFAHHADLPEVLVGPARVRVLVGEVAGARSPAVAYTPLVGAEVRLPAGGSADLPLRAGFEYGVLALQPGLIVEGVSVAAGALLYLGAGRDAVTVSAGDGTRALLLGGEPFEERIVMWWNFVARDHGEIVAAREAWASGSGFGPVVGYDGAPLRAPELPGTPLRPRGRVR
jgi:redox-sensitive bicupin YhaK (pirin superfamily)